MSCTCAKCRDPDGNLTADMTPPNFKAKLLGVANRPFPFTTCTECADFNGVEWVLNFVGGPAACHWHLAKASPCGGGEMFLHYEAGDFWRVQFMHGAGTTLTFEKPGSQFDCLRSNTFSANPDIAGAAPSCELTGVSIEVYPG